MYIIYIHIYIVYILHTINYCIFEQSNFSRLTVIQTHDEEVSFAKAYLEPIQTSTMVLYCDNSQRLKPSR